MFVKVEPSSKTSNLLHTYTVSLPQAVCNTIALPDICCTEHLPCQRHLLATVMAIIDKAGEESSAHSFTLFYVMIHVMALQPQGNLDQEVHLRIHIIFT